MNKRLRFARLAIVLVSLSSLLAFSPQATGLAPIAPATTLAAELAADPAPPQFLRDLPDLQGLISPGDGWTVGGGFLYWAQCPAADSGGGYLRRWPLSGGSVVTIVNGKFCTNTTTWAADESGLYYGNGVSILRRAASNPFVVETIAASAMPNSRIILYNGTTIWRDYIFWLADNTLRSAHKVNLRQLAAPEPLGANARSLLFANDSNFYWFANGVLYRAAKACLGFGGGTCIKDVVAGENGDNVTDVTLNENSLGITTFPLWTSGTKIRGVGCQFDNVGYSCAPSTSYSSSLNNTLGSLASDGQFLFWIENRADICGGIFGCAYGNSGRLMKWSLNQSIFSPGLFNSPQEIACSQCSASIGGIPGGVAVADGWVYFDTSNGLSRIRADAPPISWDLAFSSWEITQGIQNLNNDVPLVANKPTYVRVYGNKLSGPNARNVQGRLSGTAGNGTALGSLRSINGPQNFTANNVAPDRALSSSGWLFQLPDAWTNAGVTKLSFQIDPREALNDPNRGNNSLDNRSFSFSRRAPICLVTIPVRTHAPAASNSDPSLYRMADVTRQLMPTSDVWLYRQDNDVAQLEARFGIPPWKYEPYAVPEKKDAILRALWLREVLTDDPDRCDDVNAITHYVGLVHAGTNTKGNLGYGNTPGSNLYVKLIDQATLDTTQQFWQAQPFNTLAHELAHNYGRQHVNCGGPANTDAGYPYRDANGTNCVLDDGIRGGPLFPIPAHERYYGFDTESLTPIDPGTTADYMSYRAPFWVSDYTWRGLFSRISTPPLLSTATRQELAAATDVVYISGSIDPPADTGSLDYAWVYPSSALSQGMREKLERSAATQADQVTTQADGIYTLRLRDAAGSLLDERAITLQSASDGDGGTAQAFTMTFPAPDAAVARLELMSGEKLLASLQPGADAPAVSIISPAGGEAIDNTMTLSWSASDPNADDKLLFTVQYSPDNGQHWRVLLSGFPNRSGSDTVTLDLNELGGMPASSSGGLIRVAASDGYNTTLATSQPFTVANRAPEPHIDAPGSAALPAGQTIIVQGSATDVEDGGLSGAALSWALDGAALGSGQSQTIEGLAPGSHILTLTARDAAGKEATATQTLIVAPLAIPKTAAPAFDGICDDDAYANAARVPLAPYADGTQAFVTLLRTDDALYACFSGMKRTAVGSPGTLAVVRVNSDNGPQSLPSVNDHVFYTDEAGVLSTFNGNGTGYIVGSGGANIQISANSTSWNAEMRIAAGSIGGMNHIIGLGVEQAWVNSNSDRYPWPQRSGVSDPSSWGAASLGDLPQISDLTPASAPVGASDTVLTINGSGFTSGAIVQLSASALATTVISSTQLQATIPAANLALAGAFEITVVQPGLEAAPSNALPFSVTNPLPNITEATLAGKTITLSGSGFATGATVQFNGIDYPATGDSTQLSVVVSDADLAGSADPPVSVFNPGPGGGISNIVTLNVSLAPGGSRLYLPLVAR